MRSLSFRWRSETERDERDLVFLDDADKPVAYAGIRGWCSPDGEKEIPGIERDVKDKLGTLPIPGAMLFLASHGKDPAEGNFAWLGKRLRVAPAAMVTSSFETSPFGGKPCEFALVGFFAADCAKAVSR